MWEDFLKELEMRLSSVTSKLSSAAEIVKNNTYGNLRALYYNLKPEIFNNLNYDKYEKFVEISPEIKPDVFKYLDGFTSVIGNFAKKEKVKFVIEPCESSRVNDLEKMVHEYNLKNKTDHFAGLVDINIEDKNGVRSGFTEFLVDPGNVREKSSFKPETLQDILSKNHSRNANRLYKVIDDLTAKLKRK